MSQRPPVSLARHLLPAVAMTTAAAGLVALLDQPSSGSAIKPGGDRSASIPNQGAVAVGTQPPPVTSTVPAVVVNPTPSLVPLVPRTAPQPVATKPAVATGGACSGKTIDGPTVDTRWGPLQVEAVVSATGQICNSHAIQYPDSHGRSVQINQFALPILHSEVIRAQSANINGVSGATITSRAYQQSLQSILDGSG